jgi:hypothetical protein
MGRGMRGRGVVVEDCCFRKTPKEFPFPADESGIMLNFVFAKRPVICATMQINETERSIPDRDTISGFYEDFFILCSLCFELLKTKQTHHSRQKSVRIHRTK